MSPPSASKSARRAVQAVLLATGALMIGYAVSDHPFYGGEPGFGRMQTFIAALGACVALCAWLSQRRASSVALLVVVSAMMLAVAELAGELALGPRYRPIFQPDERLIFKFIPGRCSVMTHTPLNGSQTVQHCINGSGFRGAELRPAGAAMRVMVYGDSFIHAYYTPQADTFAAQLEKLLDKEASGGVEVINAGVSSYGPDQIALKMERELPLLRPDLVLVAIFAGNDYGDLMRNKMFMLDARGALHANRWTLDAKVRRAMELSQQESILVRALRQIRASLRASPDAHKEAMDLDFLLAEAEREYRSFVVERDDTVTNTYRDFYSADISLTPAAASARYKASLMRAVLARVRDVAAQHAVPLAFLFIPHPMDVSDDYEWGRVDRARFPHYRGRNQIALLEETARALDVPYVSLYDVFRASEPNRLYLRGADDHWNAAGQRVAAVAAADHLRSRGLPRSKRAP